MASPIDLTTLALVRQWIPSAAAQPSSAILAQQNSIIQAAITSVSADFLTRTGRGPQSGQVPTQSPFNQPVAYSETYDGTGTNRMFLRNAPIVSVSSLSIFGTAIPQSQANGLSGWTIDGTAKSISLLSPPSNYGWPRYPAFGVPLATKFPCGTQNVAVSYTAGYAEASVEAELQAIPASPGPYTVSTDLPILSDGGVKYFSNGNPFTSVQVAPQQGEYFFNNGSYLFNAADAGEEILIAYSAAGTPPDIELAARRVIFLTYLRRGWEGLASIAKPESGTTSYTKWEVSPEVAEVLRNYKREAIV